MDKKRAAMRQTREIEQQSMRLAAIEQALTAPAPIETMEIAPSAPLATHAQVEALAEQIAALHLALAPLIEPAAPADPKKK